MKTENLAKYLSTEAALADLSVFIEYISTLPTYNNQTHQFIIVGCSYPGKGCFKVDQLICTHHELSCYCVNTPFLWNFTIHIFHFPFS